MNLRDYFQIQQSLSLEPARKVAIYEKVTHQTHSSAGVFARMSFYTKFAIYSIVGVIFLVSLYAPYFGGLFQGGDDGRGGVGVQADYIGQIIEAKGDISIYNDGQLVESNMFRAGDKIVLPQGAEIMFHVSKIAQAKIVGPAEFIIEANGDGYTIALAKGMYAELKSLTPDAQASVGLRSQRVNIQPKKSQNIHFTYTEKDNTAQIDNQGESELVVISTEDNTNQEVLAIHTSAQLGSGEELLSVVATDILSGTRVSPVQVAKKLRDADTAPEKTLIGADQHEQIKAILSSEFLSNDIQRLTTSYLKGEKRVYETDFLNFYNKIAQIYSLINLPVPQEIVDARGTASLKVAIVMIENLLTKMDSNYYVAQSHHTRLKKLLGRLYALREKPFGSYENSPVSGSLLDELDFSSYKDLIN